MAIQRRHQPFELLGRSLVVWESSWETSMARSAMEAEARAQRSKLEEELKDKYSSSPEAQLLFFHEFIYAPLAAASTGDVPSVDQAFQLPAQALDAWFEAARMVDPESFSDEHTEPETVTFRDGSQITIVPAYLPSVLLKQHQLETAAEQGDPEDTVSMVTFRLLYYPRLAACSTGDVPSMEEARTQWPASELNAWYQAAKRVNPKLFLPLEELALANQAKAAEDQKKRTRSRSRSSAS